MMMNMYAIEERVRERKRGERRKSENEGRHPCELKCSEIGHMGHLNTGIVVIIILIEPGNQTE